MFNSTTFKQFLRFAAVGLTGTAVQYVTLKLSTVLYGLEAALVGTSIGYILGSVVNYILNYFLTFGSGKSHMEAASKYFTILAIGFLLNLGMMNVFLNHWGWWLWMAQVVSTGVGLCWNFGGSKLWAFKEVD
jgi:putative flippase GtrA